MNYGLDGDRRLESLVMTGACLSSTEDCKSSDLGGFYVSQCL